MREQAIFIADQASRTPHAHSQAKRNIPRRHAFGYRQLPASGKDRIAMLDRPQQHPPRFLQAAKSNPEVRRRSGRPTFYGYDIHREIWIAVQVKRARTGLSVKQICSRFHFDTLLGCFDGFPKHHRITGESLRYRYQQAVRFLKQEENWREEFRRALGRNGATCSLADRQLPVTSVWQAELRWHLAQST